jgi:hypothetical protein
MWKMVVNGSTGVVKDFIYAQAYHIVIEFADYSAHHSSAAKKWRSGCHFLLRNARGVASLTARRITDDPFLLPLLMLLLHGKVKV